MTPAVEIDKLTKDYEVGFLRKRRVRALDGLTLTVERGEIFGFLGANGAGKTTTLKLLMRLMYPTSGDARILGGDIGDTAMHSEIGYLPEHPYFYDYLTARELLEYCAELFGYRSAERKRRAADLLARVRLDEKSWDKQLRKFSKGMLQRVGLAQALVNDPEVVFLDEPMSGLDPVGRREVRDLIGAQVAQTPAGARVEVSSERDVDAALSAVRSVAGARLVSVQPVGNPLEELFAPGN